MDSLKSFNSRQNKFGQWLLGLTILLALVMLFSLSWAIVNCSNYNVQEYQGFSARITDIRIAKHGLKVIDVSVENKSNQKVEVKTVAMVSNSFQTTQILL